MANAKKVFRRTIVLALALSGTALAQEAAPTTSEMMEQIKQLQAKVAKLEAASQPAAKSADLGQPTPAAAAVESDAAAKTPAYNIGTSFSAGWDGKQFVLRSNDGNFSLHPGVVVDMRNMTSYREQIVNKGGGETNSTGYDTQNGFDLSRFRMIVDGTLFHNITYYVQLSADQGTSLTLLDAYATYHFGDTPFSVKVGQYKELWHERVLCKARLMAVDRSLVENFLGGGQSSRIQGVSFIYDRDRVRNQLILHDGFGSQNTKFFDSGGIGAGIGGTAGVTPDNFGVSNRVDFLVLGDRDATHHPFQSYDAGFTSLGFDQMTMIAGGGLDFTQAGANDVILHTADVQFNIPGGLSAYAAYLGAYRSLHTNEGVAPGYYYDPGFLFQVAYLIDKKFEPFARYDWTHLDPASVTGLASHVVQEITVGMNYYLYGQNLKLTVDGSFLPDGSPADADALGVLKNSGNNEFVLRTQFQLAI